MADVVLSGRVKFPGQPSYTNCTYTALHGVQPGSVILTVPAMGPDAPDLPAVADLELTDGERSFMLKQCRVVSLQRRREGEGVAYDVTLLDRRWQWAYR